MNSAGGGLKDDLVDQGVSGISGSGDAVREVAGLEWLHADSEATWMAKIRSVHLSSHTNNPALAHQIAGLIQHPGLLDHIDRVGIAEALGDRQPR